jgi:hypothetical protein
MYAIFLLWGDESDYQEVYALVSSEDALDREIEQLESVGVSYAWRQVL